MRRTKRKKSRKHSGIWGVLLACFLFFGLFSCDGTGDSIPDITDPTIVTELAERPAQSETETAAATVPEEETQPSQSFPATEAAIPAGSSFEIHYIDVGQASAALVLCDGKAMLIDAGDTDSASLIYSYLNAHDVDHLDALVVTHGHADHCGGAAAALHKATANTVYCSVTEYDSNAFEDFVNAARNQGLSITVPSPGDTFYLGSALVEIYGPVYPSDEPNNMSIILRITYGNTRFLFSGDAELDAENAVLDAGYDISCDVICVGHHGSYTSSGYRWLREAQATYSVISCGKNNEYGHPHEGTLSKLRDADITTYRTDLQGDIICKSDGTNVTFQVERNASVDTLVDAGTGSNHETEVPTSTTSDKAATITYVVNTNTEKFHEPSCSSVDQMKEKNRKDVTCTREELISQGYEPCGRCKP